MRIEESLESEVGNHIDFANAILKNGKIIQSKPRVYYILLKYKQKGSYDILKDISENVTFVLLPDDTSPQIGRASCSQFQIGNAKCVE